MSTDEMGTLPDNEKKSTDALRIEELEHRLTLLTIAHEDLRRRLDKLEKHAKPIERIW